jgi:glycine cleavage system H protein
MRRRVELAEAASESYPENLRYHPEHDWARLDGDEATFGITWYAQDALGEVVFFDPPEVGGSVSANESYAEVESVKAVSDVIAPLSGEVTAVNEAVSETPELINEDPYEAGWMIKVRLSNASEVDSLLDAGAYKAQLELGE